MLLYLIPESLNLPALRTCIGSLLDQPGIDSIVTTLGQPAEQPRATLLEELVFDCYQRPQ